MNTTKSRSKQRGSLRVGLLVGLVVMGVALSCPAILVWRVDFDGSSNDTLSLSNFTGWTVSGTVRTQSFANVDGSPAGSNIVVSLRSPGGTWSTAQRAMNAGFATNLYRDLVQVNTNMTLAVTNLSGGARYRVRLWFYDNSFQPGSVQLYTNITGGGGTYLGALTNVPTSNLAAGNPGLPGSLYDARYSLNCELDASAAGILEILITPTNGVNAKLNALELVKADTTASIRCSTNRFTEAPANNGTIGNSATITVSNEVFTGSDGEDFMATGKAGVSGLPDGLVPVLTRQGSTILLWTLTNAATLHQAVNSTYTAALVLSNSAFQGGDAAVVAGAQQSGVSVLFNDAGIVGYNGSVFMEASANDGSMGNTVALTLSNDTFQGADGEDFILSGRAVVSHVPAGLTAVVTRQDGSNLLFSLTGLAASHAASDSVTNLSLALQDSAFVSGLASAVTGAALSAFSIQFADPLTPWRTNDVFAYSVGALNEVGPWNTIGTTNHVVSVIDGNLANGYDPSLGRMVAFGGGGAADAAAFKLGPLSSTVYSNGTLFYSLLFAVVQTNGLSTAAAAGTGAFAGLHKSGGNTGSGFALLKAVNGGLSNAYVGLAYSSSGVGPAWDTHPVSTGATCLVVVAYDFVGGATNDVVRLWLNPTYTTFGRDLPPAPTLVVTNTAVTDVVPLSVFQLEQKTYTPALWVDDVRVGRTWADVTPAVVRGAIYTVR